MRGEVRQAELKDNTKQLLDGPLKHVRAAALAAALVPLASLVATPASAQTTVRFRRHASAASCSTTRTTTASRTPARPASKACP